MADTRRTRPRRLGLLTPALGSSNIGDFLIVEAIKRFFEPATEFEWVGTRERLAPAAIDRLNGCDAVLVCGTNLYQDKWQPRFGEEDLLQIEVPVIPFGVGSSAASLGDTRVSAETEAMIRALHTTCALGSVRDSHSVETVTRAGVTNAVLTGCPVLFWAQRDVLPEPVAQARSQIVLTARNWLMHRWPDEVDHPVQIRFLQDVLRHLRAVKVVLVIHEEYDRRLLDVLDLEGVDVVDTPRVEDYVRIYTDPENVVIAQRLHAGMLAVANGIPAVFVSHDTRSYSFCEMLGIRDIELFDNDAAERAATAALRHLRGDVCEPDARAERFEGLAASMNAFLRANRLHAAWPGGATAS